MLYQILLVQLVLLFGLGVDPANRLHSTKVLTIWHLLRYRHVISRTDLWHHHDAPYFLDHALNGDTVEIAHHLNLEITYGYELLKEVFAHYVCKASLLDVFAVCPDVVCTHQEIVG